LFQSSKKYNNAVVSGNDLQIVCSTFANCMQHICLPAHSHWKSNIKLYISAYVS